MPKYGKNYDCHLNVDLSYELRDRYREACKHKGMKMGDALRILIEAWIEVVEEERKPVVVLRKAGQGSTES